MLALLAVAGPLCLAPPQAGGAPAPETLARLDGPAQRLLFARDGKVLIGATREGLVRAWSTRSGAVEGEYRHEAALADLAPSGDGRQVVFVSGSTFGVLEAEDVEFGGSAAHPPVVLRCAVFVPRYRWLFIGQDEGILRRFQAGNVFEPGDTLGVQLGRISALAASAKGELVAAGDAAGKILLVDPRELDSLGLLEGHAAEVTGLAFDPKAETLYSSSLDRSVRVWDVEERTGRPLLELHDAPVRVLVLDAQGERLFTGDDAGTVLVTSARDGELLGRIEPGAGAVAALAVDPKGKRLATPGPDGAVLLWDVAKVR